MCITGNEFWPVVQQAPKGGKLKNCTKWLSKKIDPKIYRSFFSSKANLILACGLQQYFYFINFIKTVCRNR